MKKSFAATVLVTIMTCFCFGVNAVAEQANSPGVKPAGSGATPSVIDRFWGPAAPKLKAKIGAIDAQYLDATVAIFDQIYSRETKLDLKTRELCTITMLTSLGKPDELDLHLAAAFRIGWKFDELREVMILSAVSAGWPSSLDAIRRLYKWCAEHKIKPTPGTKPTKEYSQADWLKKGREYGQQLFGKSRWEQYLSDLAQLDPDLASFVTANLYGKLLSRSKLSDKTKELCMTASYAALKSEECLKMQILGALNSGATETEVKEVLFHAGIYAGHEACLKAARVYKSAMKAR